MSNFAQTEGLLTAAELAVKLHVSVRLVRRMAAEKEIPVVRLSKSVRFCYEDVLAALKKSDSHKQGVTGK